MRIRLDLRHLPPPEPMERILDALSTLAPGQWLDASTPMRPLPLWSLLGRDGFAWRLLEDAPGHARMAIWQRGDAAASVSVEASAPP
ncbi:DUF2249 domain-containing protein [Luteimonas sp. FCS-9]|uniref:DUF2249 domain-containing protein n=1 Tax=Luteimonas sp. FCS-9 TaxID=1547516 RepID=UPI00063E90F7|nr:DUF2249 domain-containing protein [Luteimonas sp. FCS-9]KLJ02038.1 hypothetical protein WQ56_04120 [Luteimonas sp. FCS-9]